MMKVVVVKTIANQLHDLPEKLDGGTDWDEEEIWHGLVHLLGVRT
jgi:hypothetical protein